MTLQELQRLVKSASEKMRADDNTKGTAKYLEHFSWLLFLKVFEQVEQEKSLVAEIDGRSFDRIIESPFNWSDWADGQYTGDSLISFINDELFPHLRSLTGTRSRETVAELFSGVSTVMKSGYVLAEVLKVVDKIRFREADDFHAMTVIYETLLAQMGSDSGWSGEHYTPRPLINFIVDVVDPKVGEVVFDPCSGSAGFLVEAFEHMRPKATTTQEDEFLHSEALRGQDSGEFPFLLGTMNLLLHGVTEPDIKRRNSLERDIRTISSDDLVDVVLTNPPFGGSEHPQVQRNFPIRSSSTQLLFMQLNLATLRPQGRMGVVLPESFLSNGDSFAVFRKQMLETWNVHTIVSVPSKGIWYKDVKTDLLFIDGPGPTEEIFYVEIQPPPGVKNFSRVRKPLTEEALAPFLELVNNRAESEHSWSVRVEDLDRDSFDLRPMKPATETLLTLEDAHERLSRIGARAPIVEASVESLTSALSGAAPAEADVAFPLRPLGDCITLVRDRHQLVEDQHYRRVRVALHGRGLALRDEVTGREVKTKTQYFVRQDQFVVAEIDAKLGGMGIVPPDLDGAVVSSHYFSFDVDQSVCRLGWLTLLVESGFLTGLLSAKGATNYASVRPDDIRELQVPMPEVDVQDDVLRIIDAANLGYEAARDVADELSTVVQEVRLGALTGRLTQ
ncbi:N-6 DNA methylase [Herbiconiux sp. A18JL235]|uniref:site-specific DNA-methyltransferase (adenine-specific) n=1 Tax=Herbiconiux sp. A18JL235 TaxID=3152363 RepID=A0AB39BNB1_9MICO